MIKSRCYKLIVSMAFIPLIGCGSGSSSSNSTGFTEVSTEKMYEESIDNVSFFDVIENYQSLEISWDDLADNEDGFLIERSIDGADDFSILVSVEANQISYVDDRVLLNTVYCYRIGAYNKSGIAYSDISCNE